MNPKYENLHYIDLGASLRKFNDVIKSRKQGDMPMITTELFENIGFIFGILFFQDPFFCVKRLHNIFLKFLPTVQLNVWHIALRVSVSVADNLNIAFTSFCRNQG